MISFKPFDEDSFEQTLMLLSDLIPQDELQIATDVMRSALQSADDVELAVSYCHGCLILRVFDYGRYYFMYPYEISESADAQAAVDCINEYAIKEEIPLTVADVPSECLASLILGFRHLDVDADAPDCSSYRITVKTECQLLSEIPEIEVGELTLDALTESDIKKYAELARNPLTNEFWGYDYRVDNPDADDNFFYDSSRLEFERGITLTVAVRWCKKLVGEVLFYAFDGRGAAEIAVRIFPDFWGRGIGKRAVESAKLLASKIGLTRLYADVMKSNERSIQMFSSIAEKIGASGDRVKFSIEL